MYGYVGNNPANATDLFGLCSGTITMYYDPSVLSIPMDVRDDVRRILKKAVDTYSGDDSNNVNIIWARTTRSANQLELGKNSGGYSVYLYVNNTLTSPVTGMAAYGFTGSNQIGINFSQTGSGIYLSTTIAHEVFHHAMGDHTVIRNSGHWDATGYVDSQTGQPGGVLSPNAGYALVDRLGCK